MRTRVCDRCDGKGTLPCHCEIDQLVRLKLCFLRKRDDWSECLFIGKCTGCDQVWKVFTQHNWPHIKHTFILPGETKDEFTFPLEEAAVYQTPSE